ncbi:DUF6959 family protein [Kutzneria kofuensis]|uniref:DUF6959 family protein n=1 Tax=Kutzneria kofuensis TaxID=103725 RepID=UPI0035E4170A
MSSGGDSLKSLDDTVSELVSLSEHGDFEGIREVVEEVHDAVHTMLASYEIMMRTHDLKLPYTTDD